MDALRELHLFAGAGGGILGGILLGHTTVCAVELDPYCRRVLLQRQRDGFLPRFPIWDDIRTFDGTPWRGRVDVVCGGFPCQDISAAGKGAGITGERSGLWVEMARVIREIRPRFVLVENSPMLTSRGLGVVLGDLAAMGFDARWGVLGADDAGAPHIRKRIWILADSGERRCGGPKTREDQLARGAETVGPGFVADSVCDRRQPDHGRESVPDQDGDGSTHEARREVVESRPSGAGSVADAADNWPGRREQFTQGGEATGGMAHADQPGPRNGRTRKDRRSIARGCGTGEFPDANCERLEGQRADDEACRREDARRPAGLCDGEKPGRLSGWWESEPDVGRVADGVAARVDRLRALGNGQVPAVAALAWRVLMVERVRGAMEGEG